jgi:ribosomal protein S27AE
VELECTQCGRWAADHDERGWKGYLVDLDDDGRDEVAYFCPTCAQAEFGES